MSRLLTAIKLWAAVVAVLYATLAYGSYVTLPSHAGGMQGFDMRPLGMSVPDAFAYIEVITEAGRAYYQNWLKPLDTAFIVTLTGLLCVLCWRLKGVLGGFGAIAALCYAVLDWLENDTVLSILNPNLPSKDLIVNVEIVGSLTLAKFLSLFGAILAITLQWRRIHAPR